MTGASTFDKLLDKEIVSAFATVAYEDGTIGIINLDSPGVMSELWANMFPED